MGQVFPAATTDVIIPSGDLGGTPGVPLVVGLQGHPIATGTPTTGDALGWNGTTWEGSTLAAGVSSFATRTGAVVPASGDYTAAQVTHALDLSDASLQTMSGPLDVTGTMSATGQVTSAETSTTVPGFEFIGAPASAPNFGVHVGIGLDNNDSLIFNVAGSGKSIKTAVGGSVSNVLDNGSGIASFSHVGTAAAQTTPTITSGTAFQVDASYDVDLIVPVTMTPTATVTATVAVAMGPTGTPPTLWTETVPLGVANDSFLTAIQLRVPKGWYVNLTLVNTTFTLGATANAYVIG